MPDVKRSLVRFLGLAAVLAGPAAAVAETGDAAWLTEYRTIQAWAPADVALAVGGTESGCAEAGWELGGASISLASGSVRPLAATSTGAATGLYFAGEGTLAVAIDSRQELVQLRRFLEDPAAEGLELAFTKLVLRAPPARVRSFLAACAPGEPASSPAPKAARQDIQDRHNHWLRIRRYDADARILRAMANGETGYLRVDFLTAKHGWVTLDFDSERWEELQVEVFRSKKAMVERWLALDVEPDAARLGRAGLEHVDVEASLLKLGKDPGGGATGRYRLLGEYRARLRLRPEGGRAAALQLYLGSWARVVSVEDSRGRELGFLRYPIGERHRSVDNRIHDSSLVVLLEQPLEGTEVVELVVSYELETANFAPGRGWYPVGDTLERGVSNRHTARMRITARDEYDILAMGRRLEESESEGLRTAVWTVEVPVKMVTFTITRRKIERILEAKTEGVPDVVVFAPPVGHDTEARLEALGADVLNSIHFFQELYAEPLAVDRLHATLIEAGHGQAFDGFLHLADSSAWRSGETGTAELFLAHEVAHEWWGHLVGWTSYRDQWLSEGFAEYAAMMFVEASLEKGDKIFEDVVKAYVDELTGSLESAMSGFTSRERALGNKVALARIGPIGHGYRAATSEAPGAYVTQTYRKGALVVHMLRELLSFLPGGDEIFVAILRDFIDAHKGSAASTADLEAAVERHAPSEWAWFFEQWVRRSEIPVFRWRAKIADRADEEGNFPVELTVRQERTAEDFTMYVPVEAQFGKKASARVLVKTIPGEQTLRLSFPRKPRRVVFNPKSAILAKTEKL